MTVPPYACGFVVSLLFALFSDRFRARGPTTALAGIFATVGYIMFYGEFD